MASTLLRTDIKTMLTLLCFDVLGDGFNLILRYYHTHFLLMWELLLLDTKTEGRSLWFDMLVATLHSLQNLGN